MMKIGRRGSLNGHVFARGKQGHVAYPERAHNPLPALARVAAALSRHEFDRGHGAFRAHQSRSHVDRRRQSHDQCDPRRGRASFNIRFNDLWTPESLAERVREIALAAADDTAIEVSSFRPATRGPF